MYSLENIDELVQERRNSSALALSCINPSICIEMMINDNINALQAI